MDVLFSDTGDGGEFVLEGGDLAGDKSYLNALYLSLFTGDCYSNIFEKYETNGDFQKSLSETITIKNLQNTERLGKKATKWMIEEGLAESIEFSAYGNAEEKINVNITISEPTGNDYPFAVIWENERAILKAR